MLEIPFVKGMTEMAMAILKHNTKNISSKKKKAEEKQKRTKEKILDKREFDSI